MGPAIELFMLLLLGVGIVAGGVIFFTRPLWKRAAKTVFETDRQEREVLEEQARERVEEAECRRQAEEELQRCLKGEEIPRARAQREEPSVREEVIKPCEEPKEVRLQQLDRERQ